MNRSRRREEGTVVTLISMGLLLGKWDWEETLALTPLPQERGKELPGAAERATFRLRASDCPIDPTRSHFAVTTT